MSAASSAAPPSFQEVARHGASSSRSNGTRTSGSGSGSGRSSLRTASMGPTADASQLSQAEHLIKSTLAEAGNPRQRWTFSSSGWLFVYFFGVIKVLRDLKLNENIYVIGSSGGACAGSFLFLPEVDIDACVEYIQECAVRARGSLRDALRISEYVKGAIDRFQPPGAAQCLQGNMEVSVTRLQLPWKHWPPLPFRNVRIRNFVSDKQMEESIIASARIVPVPPIQVEGIGSCIDGVFTDSQLVSSILLGRSFFTLHLETLGGPPVYVQTPGPTCKVEAVHAQDAISVCPFYSSRADIVPSRYVNPTWAAYPPEPQKLAELYELGYRDALAWLLKNGKIPIGFAGADTADTADSSTARSGSLDGEVPAWRQRLTATLVNIQAGMVEAGQMVRDGATSAVGCDAAAEELVTEAVTRGHLAVSLLSWLLIFCEMFWHSCISATVAAWAPVLPLSTRDSWRRFTDVSRSMASPRLFLKCVPALSPHIDLNKNKDFAQNLRKHSILYRLLQHVVL